MKVTAPEDLYVPALVDTECGGVVEKGQEVDVSNALGKRLVEQGWKSKTGKEKPESKPVSPARTPEK